MTRRYAIFLLGRYLERLNGRRDYGNDYGNGAVNLVTSARLLFEWLKLDDLLESFPPASPSPLYGGNDCYYSDNSYA